MEDLHQPPHPDDEAQHPEPGAAKSPPLRAIPAHVVVVALLALAAGWILFTGNLHPDELIVGALSLLASGAFLYLVGQVRSTRQRVTLRDVLTGWPLPWYILRDVFVVLKVLARDLAGSPAGSFFRISGFKTSRRDPEDVGRRVLVTVYTSAAPNSIVLGVDYTRSLILLHQLERSEFDPMVFQLGARR